MPKTTRLPDPKKPKKPTDPPTLLAILIGARRGGNRTLERAARRLLENDHRIKVLFLNDAARREARQ